MKNNTHMRNRTHTKTEGSEGPNDENTVGEVLRQSNRKMESKSMKRRRKKGDLNRIQSSCRVIDKKHAGEGIGAIS